VIWDFGLEKDGSRGTGLSIADLRFWILDWEKIDWKVTGCGVMGIGQSA
jgi:hypothetical protein